MAQFLHRRDLMRLLGSTALTVGVAETVSVRTATAAAEPRAPRHWEHALQQEVDAGSAARISEAMSTYPGLVGTEGSARRVKYSTEKLTEWGLDARLESYSVYSSVPKDISVTMTAPERRELDVKEPPFPWHENFDDVVVGYNAYSPAGDVTAEVVYVNYGLPEDYAKLAELGVDVEGKLVLARYGRSFRGVKSKVAEEHGAAGVILYSDPEDDGFVRGEVYPDGPWRNADGIQRGSVQYIFQYPGDPLTPGEPSKPGTARLDPSEAKNLPGVPTTPISYGQAEHLLVALEGPRAPQEWQGGLDFEYRIGPGPTTVNLALDIDYQQVPVHDVLVEIPGSKYPQQKVVLGAHYDSWTYGTKDDVCGWTTVMETARAMSRLREQGWQPERTIVLAGWGGEEYGLLGSTEWAEEHRDDLVQNAVAYLNLDGAGGGRNFSASAVPALDGVLTDIAKEIEDPDHGTVYDNWQQASGEQHPVPGRLGSGSDYTAFLDHLGIACADVGMSTPAGEYHSAYDDLHTMRNFLDPGYTHHAVAAAYAGTFALRMAGSQTLPMAYSGYAGEVVQYLKALDEKQAADPVVDLAPAYSAAREWRAAAKQLEGAARNPGDGRTWRINAALIAQERALVQDEGLPGREWFKHMVYAPGFYTGYAVQPLSAIDDAVAAGDSATASQYRDLLVESMEQAASAARDGAGR
ncbi:M28 family peptidase [Actinopolyspora saharensis]|uniref:N-acetylated-alpha-linked acidic dipeptidase n=1 Tax=Actinopolyspora saharensis TaxID=995062 RepID=A0A1H1AG23_9ACTN|nr:M28 family peptidase [Actinopolyspora saharensis]SDQ38683.1 N-acetylated-alpha-linked acidic dipeptidase [Actinopolyspora saharensis]